jgi:hypothetical protein
MFRSGTGNQLSPLIVLWPSSALAYNAQYIHRVDSRLTDGDEVVTLSHRPRFTPQKTFLFLVLVSEELRGPSPRANYTDQATFACHEFSSNFLRIEGATWSA